MVLIDLTDIQPQGLIHGAGVMADDKRGVAVNFQALAELADIAAGITGGKGCRPDPVPGYIMDDVGELVHVDQDLSRDLSACGSSMAGNEIFCEYQ